MIGGQICGLLRELKNNANSSIRSWRNASGFKGVSWDGRREKWYARVRLNGKQKWLGYFDNPTDAYAAYAAEAKKAFGEFFFSGNEQILAAA